MQERVEKWLPARPSLPRGSGPPRPDPTMTRSWVGRTVQATCYKLDPKGSSVKTSDIINTAAAHPVFSISAPTCHHQHHSRPSVIGTAAALIPAIVTSAIRWTPVDPSAGLLRSGVRRHLHEHTNRPSIISSPPPCQKNYSRPSVIGTAAIPCHLSSVIGPEAVPRPRHHGIIGTPLPKTYVQNSAPNHH